METFTITKFDDHIRIESNLGCVRVEPNSVKSSIVAKAGGHISAGSGDIKVDSGDIMDGWRDIKASYGVPADWSDIFAGVAPKK